MGQRSEGGQIKSFGVQEKKRFHPVGLLGKAFWRRWHLNRALETGRWDQGAEWKAWLGQVKVEWLEGWDGRELLLCCFLGL